MHEDETIHTNQKHPFLTVEAGFVPVSDLNVGMHLVEGNGQIAIIEDWLVVAGSQTMYNLTVQQDHTYTVGNGQFVVHNTDCTGFLNKNRLTRHFDEHGGEFDPPFENAEDYEQAGKNFMSGDEVPEDVHQASINHPGSKFHGDVVRYRESTNEFGLMTQDGVLRSYYPPTDGIQEFYRTLSH